MGLRTPSAPWSFSSSFPGDLVLHPMVGCEYPFLYLSGTGRAFQETAISGSCEQALIGVLNSVWVWWMYMGWIPRWGSLWMVIPSVSALNFVYVTPFVGILFPLLRRIEISLFCFVFRFSFQIILIFSCAFGFCDFEVFFFFLPKNSFGLYPLNLLWSCCLFGSIGYYQIWNRQMSFQKLIIVICYPFLFFETHKSS